MDISIDTLLKATIAKGSSDLHVKVGSSPMIRMHGVVVPLDPFPKLSQQDTLALAFSMMSTAQQERFKAHGELDMAYSSPGLGRFRVNVFRQRGTVALVLRVVPATILSMQSLLLPPVIEKLALEQRGMIIVTGTTNSGKSTTLASMVDYINQNRNVHIVTIEDPIEFLHRDKKGLVNQREIGQDTESFSVALRSALRQDPDVILVGEMRDYETMSTALQAAETGHLVMSTLHTLDAVETINRMISIFPPYQSQSVRLQMAAVIKGIVSMRLVPRMDKKGRVPAVEVMIATQTIREAIIEADRTRRIHDLIAAGTSQYGMQTFDQSLYEHLKGGRIAYEEALRWSSNPDDFALRVRGIQSTSESWEANHEEAGAAIPIERF